MTKRICFVLIFALFAGAVPSAAKQAGAQNSEKNTTEQRPGTKSASDKNAKEQSTSERKPETTATDSGVNYPQVMGAVELRSAGNARITLKLTDTSRAIYEAIGKQAKISMLFDPDYIHRNISVDLDGVSLQDALKIVAFQSRTFWRPVTSTAIFVAADSQAKRREFEQQIVKSFYLPNVSTPTDLQDIVNGLRTIVEIQRVQQTPSNNTILVRATTEQMALAERIIDDLSQARQKNAGGYRLEIKVNELKDEKRVNSRTYTLLVEPHEIGKLRTISHVAGNDVGKNIDCQVRSETERTVELRLIVEVLDLAPAEHSATEPAHNDAVPQQFRMETSVALELGKPTVVSNFGDPSSKRMFQIEATVTRAKE